MKLKMWWTIPVEVIKTVQCLYCNETGDTKWAEEHLAEKKYWKLPKKEQKGKWGTQFMVTERLDGR
jgi:hypothetical protein